MVICLFLLIVEKVKIIYRPYIYTYIFFSPNINRERVSELPVLHKSAIPKWLMTLDWNLNLIWRKKNTIFALNYFLFELTCTNTKVTKLPVFSEIFFFFLKDPCLNLAKTIIEWILWSSVSTPVPATVALGDLWPVNGGVTIRDLQHLVRLPVEMRQNHWLCFTDFLISASKE